MAEIKLEQVAKSFGTFAAVKGVSFTVDHGSFFVILGPSGCGKTTSLRMIAGLELPTAGRILLDGEDVTALRASARDIAFVFQLFALYPHMDVRQNIGFPLRCQNVPKAQIKKSVEEAARLLRIDHLLDRRVGGLSGGDRQRVALGRAIVRRPKAFLMDEPLGALDSEFRHLMCGELRELHDRIDATSIYITHDQLEAMAMADRIAIMNQGRVEQIGTPQQIYDRPKTMFVADFIGAPPMSFLNVQTALRQGDRVIRIDGAQVEMPELFEARPEGKFALGVRPENVSFADSSQLRGRVIGAEYLGTTQIVTVTTAGGQVKARLPSGKPVRIGETVGLNLRRDKLSLFDAASGQVLSSALDAEQAMADISLVDVSKRFGAVEAIRDLSLSILEGEFVVLLGPTGAGKTTTLRLIAGLERPDQGSVVIRGRDVTAEVPAERDVAFVFQQYSLYPHLTVYDNLAFPLRSPARRMDEAFIRRRIHQVAELLHIEQKLSNRATALSGGEMQRVAIGRALVREPAVYLMDEPLSSLDAKLRAELRLELKRIQRELGTTILYVTHDQIEAMTMADRIGVMSAGELIQLGAPRDIYERPTSVYVASRLGTPAINLVPAELLANQSPPVAARTVGLRTEHIRIFAADGSGPRARVHWVEHLGDQNHVHLKLGSHSLVTLADPTQELKAGDEVSLEFMEPLYFDQSGNRIAGNGAHA